MRPSDFETEILLEQRNRNQNRNPEKAIFTLLEFDQAGVRRARLKNNDENDVFPQKERGGDVGPRLRYIRWPQIKAAKAIPSYDCQAKRRQATTIHDLLKVRAFHIEYLRRHSHGSALGYRVRDGVATNIPAIIVFVSRKVSRRWISETRFLPKVLEEPGGLWCDVDVIEFSYCCALQTSNPPEQSYSQFVEGLRGDDSLIGPGYQISTHVKYGTMGAIVQSKIGAREVGFVTSRHVAFELESPSQHVFHPVPPSLGNGVFLGTVERATSFVAEEDWYGEFAGNNSEIFVRADGAFIPLSQDFDVSSITSQVKGIGKLGRVFDVDLHAPLDVIVGKTVTKVGRSTGLTKGSILGCAVEYLDEGGTCFMADFIIVGEGQGLFDLEGDSGSLIMIGEENRPLGILWGGSTSKGRLKLKNGEHPVNWTIAVDLGRLLNLLELDIITTDDALKVSLEEARQLSSAEQGISGYVKDKSHVDVQPRSTEMRETGQVLAVPTEGEASASHLTDEGPSTLLQLGFGVRPRKGEFSHQSERKRRCRSH